MFYGNVIKPEWVKAEAAMTKATMQYQAGIVAAIICVEGEWYVDGLVQEGRNSIVGYSHFFCSIL